tara:strand:- start:109 stop:591 length:483 start_codon:yes stop_codon:yes gene_type:complete
MSKDSIVIDHIKRANEDDLQLALKKINLELQKRAEEDQGFSDTFTLEERRDLIKLARRARKLVFSTLYKATVTYKVAFEVEFGEEGTEVLLDDWGPKDGEYDFPSIGDKEILKQNPKLVEKLQVAQFAWDDLNAKCKSLAKEYSKDEGEIRCWVIGEVEG